MRCQRLGDRGIILISSYLLLGVLLIYSNTLTLRAITHRLTADRLRERYQALDLAQGAMEDLQQELYAFWTSTVAVAIAGSNTLEWLDALDQGNEAPLFDPDGDGNLDGRSAAPWCVATLPTMPSAAACVATAIPEQPRAWIVSVANLGEDLNGNGVLDAGEDTNPANGQLDTGGGAGFDFSPRLVTIRAQANVGGLTQTIEAGYLFALSMSDVFRYAYFINNYGWFTPTATDWDINGDIRANGDIAFQSATSLELQGDLTSTGAITGIVDNENDEADYFSQPGTARPTRRLVFPNQPAISGTSTVLPYGQGWNTEGPTFPTPQRFENQDAQPMPYLGDLGLYEQLADDQNSSLRYYVRNSDGTLSNTQVTVNETYNPALGPDGQAGTADDGMPLVLVGTSSKPIVIDGPVVVPGDVIIKGYVSGRGTLYAGRNVHIIGELEYKSAFVLPKLERDTVTGQLRADGDATLLGVVCNDGTYMPLGTTPPATCMQP